MALHTSVQERLVAASIAALIVMLAGYALIIGLSVDVRGVRDRAITLIDLHVPPPPPPPKQRVEKAHSKAAKQAPSPRNLKNEATKIVVPPPVIPLPAPPPIIAAPRAGVGMAPSNGASSRAGPGQGAGGEGNGLGGGGDGDGDGDDIPPRQTGGRIKFSDMPADLRAAGVGGAVDVRYRVGVDGKASECTATKSSGNAELDRFTCQLIEQRFRFKPSRDSDGNPVPSFIVETHSWIVDRSDDQPSKP
jgi:protein TonB